LDAVEKRKISSPAGNQTPAVQRVAVANDLMISSLDTILSELLAALINTSYGNKMK
jgi:hypothetical protein